LVVSEVVVDELQEAPERVRRVHEEHPPWAEFVSVSVEAVRLRDACLKASVVTAQWATDALHVAVASVHRCRLHRELELQAHRSLRQNPAVSWRQPHQRF